MASPIKQAVIAAYQSARQLADTQITLSRPSTGHSVSLEVIPAETLHEVERDGIVEDVIKSRDFLILASELVLNSVEVKPERYDMITHDGNQYELLAAGGSDHWKFTDFTEAVIRVFTRKA